MKLFSFVVLVLAALAMFLGGSSAAPKGGGGGLKKGLKAIRSGIGAIGAIGTGHEVYQHVRDRNQG